MPDDRQRIAQVLIRSIAEKEGRACQEALGLLTWLDGGAAVRLADGARVFRAATLRCWRDLAPDFRSFLLREQWSILRDPSFVSVLRAEVDADRLSQPWHVDDLGSLALLRYAELEPADGRRRILEDIVRDSPRFGRAALTSLSDAHLGEVDALFRATPEDLRRRDGFEKHVALAERYGGPPTLPTVLALLKERRWACDILESLLGYVLKHDRAQGLRLVERAVRTRGSEETGCYRRVLLVLRNYWGPDARALVDTFRDDTDADVRRTVADLLNQP